jgi:mannose-6-phosphate isomerase-like protein (cupin superfamily)
MTTSPQLPVEATVLRATETDSIRFSPTSEFRVIFAGAPGLPSFYEERSGRGDGAPLHRHPWAAWELIVEGHVRVVVGDQELRLGPGDAIFIPANLAHTYMVESERAWVIGMDLSDGRFLSLQRQVSPVMNAPGGPDMQKIMGLAKAHAVEVLGPPIGQGVAR